jgi:simple sugar transport system permease protein
MKQLKGNVEKSMNMFLRTLTDDKKSKILVPIVSIILSMATASVILLIMGADPIIALSGFLRGSGFLLKPAYAGNQNMFTDFLSFLAILAPMMLAALGVSIAMRAGLFNIGTAGQMLAAGFTATIIIGYSGLDAWIAKPLVILIGMSVGGAMGAAIGFLKYKFNIHEVVSSIMFNYIISYITGFFLNGYFIDAITRSSRIIKPAARLNINFAASGSMRLTIPIGILIAFAAVFIIRFVLDRTVIGFEIKAVGLNKKCAQYSGIRVGNITILAMFFSGILAGLAGVSFYLGYYNTIIPRDLASLGYDAIAAALLGNISPLGCIFSSTLITVFQKGAVYMSSTSGIPREIASVITGILLLFSACGVYMRYWAGKQLTKMERKNKSEEGSTVWT